MPISEYYSGKGREVMDDMVARYGAKKGKEVFYATSNKHPGFKPSGERKPSPFAHAISGGAHAFKEPK